MKPFLVKSLLFFVLFAATVALLHPGFFHTPLNQNYLLKYKLELLDKSRGTTPKIVIIGGSNASFAFRSADLEEALGRRVINASVNIHEGLRFYLHLADPFLQEGDILLICPEYDNLDGDTFYGSKKFVLNAYTYPRFYGMLAADLPALAHFVANTPWHVENFLDFVFRLKFLKDRDQFENEILASYNERGDWSQFVDTPAFANFPITIRAPISAHLHVLASQVQKLDERGVKCLWMYPPVCKSNLDLECDLETYDRAVRSIPRLGVLASPGESVYEDSRFYDSPYHLNESAGKAHTQLVIDRLRRVIDSPREN